MDLQIKVGYLISPRKLAKLNLEAVIKNSTKSRMIDLKAIDPYKSLAEQQLDHLDIIIHRLHDYINQLEGLDPNEYAQNLIKEIDRYKIKILSPLNVIEILSDRMKCLMKLKPLEFLTLESFSLKLPPMLEIKLKTSRNDVERLCYDFQREFLLLDSNSKFTRPFIVKTTKCIYTDEYRYRMCLYFNMDKASIDGIMDFLQNNSIVLQPFYNHDGLLFKLFILGDKWHLETRPSIKNFDFAHSNSNINFLSNSVSKSDSRSTALHDSERIKTNLKSVDPFDHHNLVKKDIDLLVESIGKCIDCPMLGIDMLIECNTRNMYIVDVNYFPGYDGFCKSHNLGDAFIDLFYDQCNSKITK